jgi:MG2 domain-containing protein
MRNPKASILTIPLVLLLLLAIMPSGFAQTDITVDTDKDSFSAGDQISITGSAEGPAGTPVAIEIRDADGQTLLLRTVKTDESGSFALQFKVPQSAKSGEFTIYANAKIGEETVSNTRVVSITSQQEPSPTSQCIIATAAFGSELAPQVQFLRNFRDQHILATVSGSNFMNVFNSWYYSFSPAVADYERGQPWLQQAVRITIVPLLAILQVAQASYSVIPGEYGSLVAGLVASSLIGAVYASPVALSIKQVRRAKLNYKIFAIAIAVLSISVITSLAANNSIGLMVATSLLVLSAMVIGAVIGARAIFEMSKRIYNKLNPKI